MIYGQGIRNCRNVLGVSRKGNCYDNAVVESFFSSLKNELTHECSFQDRTEARHAIVEYSEGFSNRQRLHQTLGYRSPEEFERQASDSERRVCFFRATSSRPLFSGHEPGSQVPNNIESEITMSVVSHGQGAISGSSCEGNRSEQDFNFKEEEGGMFNEKNSTIRSFTRL